MSAAGLIGSLTGPLSRTTLPTASGSYGASGFSSTQSRSLDGSVSSIGSPIQKRRPSSGSTATTTPIGRGRQAYPTTSGYPCMTYLSAVQGLPQVVPSGQLSANAPEFIPRRATHLRSMRRLWEPRESPMAAQQVSSSTCRMYSSTGSVADTAGRPVTSRSEPADGCLVEYQKDRKSGLALLLKKDGKRNWAAVDSRGIMHSLRPQQIAYILPGDGYKEADLETILATAQAACGDEKLMELAWEVVTGSEDSYDVSGMAELLFGKVTVANSYAAHRLLNEDRTYFKQVNRGPPHFQPRSETEVRSIQAKAAADAKAARELAECGAALREAKAGTSAQDAAAWRAGPYSHRIHAVEAFALEKADAKETQLALETLQAAGMVPGSGGAAELLGRIGVWGPHDNIGLRQSGLTADFPPALQEAAAALLERPPPDLDEGHRLDLTHHQVVTIDDASTTEVDDGLSVEFLDEGRVRLWVHVADPTRWVRPEDPLDREARRRGSTMYLPTGAIFMFPGVLAEGPFSLRQGERSCALSISAELSPEGELLAHSVVASHVTPARRMTYHEVDEALASNDPSQISPDLCALHQASEARQAWRLRQGAAAISLDECVVHVADPRAPDPAVTLERVQQWDSPSRTLVSEMMILAGQVAATVGQKVGLALPYRGQAKAVLPSEADLAGVPEGPCRAVLLRSRMVRGVCTTHDALPHAGLGLPAYVQVTSPIRRYSDLLAHWQLKAHLRGQEPPWGVHSLSVLLDDVTSSVREHIALEREITNYWLAKYFQAEMAADPSRTWSALLLHWIRQDTGLAQVQLDESGLETVVRIDRPATVGERLELRCASTDVRAGIYRLEEAHRLPAQQAEGAYLGEPGEGEEEDGMQVDTAAAAEDTAAPLGLAAHV
ncbi:g8187 [Coccomyxa elongata]